MSFWEIVVIVIVALIVIGPKRLPGVAFWLGRCLKKARALTTKLKSDLEQQVQDSPPDEKDSSSEK